MRIAHICCAVFILSHAAAAGGSREPLYPGPTDRVPIIDGVLDDMVWQRAPSVSAFRTFIPDFGRSIAESTIAYYAYDRDNLYFAFRCFDPDPSSIKADITNRDNIVRHDFICINLDSFNDQQSLYAFYVNPLGIQMDSRFAGNNEDFSVDLVWYSAGKIDSLGYTVEMRIPVQSIRYADTDPVTMSVFFERQISKRSEHVSFPEMDPRKGYQFLTQMQQLVYPGLAHSTVLEVLPAWTYTRRSMRHTGESLDPIEDRGEGSLTLKYGITSNLVLDGTYNPDFSQVEADAGQVDVNLRSALFLSEKRPFFLEGSEVFNIAARNDAVQEVFHSRNISDPVAGLKLSGKIGPKSTLAAVLAVDETLSLGSGRATYPIVRYKQALSDDSYLGGIYAGVEHDASFNRVGGVDGSVRTGASSTVEFHLLGSQSGSGGLRSEGIAGSAFLAFGSRDLDFNIGASRVSPDFANDAGYLARTGVLTLSAMYQPKFYPSSEILRRVVLQLATAQARDEFSSMWETYSSAAVSTLFPGTLSATLRGTIATEVFLGQKFSTDYFQITGGGQVTKRFSVSVVYRRSKQIYYGAVPYQGSGQRMSASVTFQPWNQFEAAASVVQSSFTRDSDGALIYDYPIGRLRLTYQVNQYLFFRGIAEYNKYRRTLLTDGLVSFTYIPGTVVHLGYGSVFQRTKVENNSLVNVDQFSETGRGFFFKMAYLWRM